ncbi:diguanylate cyclase [Azospira oryzae]|jgi:diguanylate cyclase (GGDEF)-like protein/PAS domain S-box-containing protein|uniref:PAS domain S-box-containing protein/diguanylate cyclase (GGDEF)-like protein n=1 Tax=Azospira oryzae TaxID=146939 RepID=A0ABY0IT13_9RHOO|nr:diguanylate cyclase [Azospira oryzae]MBP7489875.1 diguanylate cyclase [Azospira sp.]RZT90207.1 PAS domain S-box-containing protein/diguanylate cyclase (GGDEF)-like protein [Azospira oryzae]TLS18049.1 MAG: diguanylate cyclase [Betaproteobacteria bacterium]
MHYDLPISQILRHELLECAPQTTVAEAAGRMHQARCGSILVVELGEVRGIWTERDALALNFSDPESIHLPVSRVMSTPVKTVRETDTVADAAIRFKQERLRHLLVVDRDGRRLGIVSQTDIVNHQGVEFYVHMRDVGSVLKSAPLQVPGSMPVAEAVQRLREARSDAAIVEHNGHLGILTGRDVLRLIGQESLNCSAGEVATFPLITVPRSSTLYHTRKIFNDRRIRHLGVMDEHGRITGLLSYADILDSVEQEYVAELRAALQEQSQRLQQSRHALLLASKVAESSQQAIMIVNAERIIQSINPAFSAITGYSAEEAVGHDTRLLKSGLHDADFYRQLYADLAAFGVWSGEIWNRRKNGELYPENLTITSVKGEGGQVINYVCVFTDMTEQKRARDDLKESHQRLEQQSSLTEMILDTLPVMVFVKDEDGRYLVMNEAAAAFVGHDKHEVVGRSDFELYPADVASRLRQDDIKALAAKKVTGREEKHLTPKGERYLLSYKRGVDLGGRRLLIGSSTDISERKQAEQLLAAERQVLELIASDASLQVVLDALCNRVESLISDCFAAVLLLQPDNGHLVLGSAPSLRRTCRDVGQNCPENPAVCACAAAIRTGKQIIAEHIDDSEQWQDCRDFASALGLKTAWSTPIVSPGKEVLGTLSLYFRQGRRPNRFDKDVIEHACRQAAIAIDRNRAMDSLHRLATVDTLTGLNNRSRFLDQGEAEITRARRLGRSVAVLMLDVDHFKRINDTHGHGAGDVALKIVAAIIARELRAIDICGRLGGEEFAVMLPETDGQGAMQAAERLRQAVAQEKVRVAEGVELGITVSIGATILAPQDANIDHLLARADGALYEAKRSGRNLALYAAPGNIPS